MVGAAVEPEHLGFELTVRDARGVASFTGHYEIRLISDGADTRLNIDLRVTDSTVEAAPFIAGIPTGWGQVLDQLMASVERSLQNEQKDGPA